MKKSLLLIIIMVLFLPSLRVKGREILNLPAKRVSTQHRISADACDPPSTQTDLDLNNVRARIFTASDMWWDLITQAQYEIPKGSNRYSLFAGSIWVGGLDAGKSLHAACQTYRQQSQNDFWSGPLDSSSVITKAECAAYDRHFKITRKEVEQFLATKVASPAISNWPAQPAEIKALGEQYLAPFEDVDGDGSYNPGAGDFPKFNFGTAQQKANDLSDKSGRLKKTYLYGDQVLWWVFNDQGDKHTATDPAKPIGLEVKAQAFAFQSKPGDPISNMTFYQYTIINKSHTTLDSAWFGQWVDPDLGYAFDDYVGCDVTRGLGYCYNGDNFDDGALGYGANPPSVGVDFFEGPLADSSDHVDNNRNGTIDEPGEEIIMSQFVYFNNDGTVQGNPDKGSDYFNYLRGRWRDGNRMTYGGNGKGGSAGATSIPCDFMFPDNTDPKFSTPWTEVTAGNVVGDRRFIQSAGHFKLNPGAVNYITDGVVWARANGGGNTESLKLLKQVDDQAQQLFDRNFEGVKGPDAPDLTIREMDQELIVTLTNNTLSNNFRESYKEVDPYIKNSPDSFYRFQGYMIFQLKDPTVLGSYLDEKSQEVDPNKAKIVAQCDIADTIGRISNYFLVSTDTVNVFQPTQMVHQAEAPNDFFNAGIQHSFRVTKDYFTGGKLIDNKTYYYVAIAYGFNRQESIKPTIAGTGRYLPYISGSRNAKVYQAVPHIVTGENGGMILNSKFGSGPQVKRIKGFGNGGNELDMIIDDNIFNKYLAGGSYRIDTIAYSNAKSPVGIKVIDPVKVPKADFTIKFDSISDRAHWKVINNTNGQIISSDTTLGAAYQQVIPKWGISISVKNVKEPLQDRNVNPVLGSSITWSDSTAKWLNFFKDADQASLNTDIAGNWTGDWIKVGETNTDYTQKEGTDKTVIPKIDPNQFFEKMLDGMWAPFWLASDSSNFPGLRFKKTGGINSITVTQLQGNLKNLGSVLLVITPDKSKWSRCPVLESEATAAADANKYDLKSLPSLDKDGNQISGDNGMSYFPGYVVNMETGERLNLAFSEDKSATIDNGNDMMWNPTRFSPSTDPKINHGAYLDSASSTFSATFKVGGKHFIFIFNSTYDEGAGLKTAFEQAAGSISKKEIVFQQAMWTCIPYLKFGFSFAKGNIPPNEVRVRLSVAKPYHAGKNAADVNSKEYPEYSFNTNDLYARLGIKEVAENAMDLIRVVPNPYYAHTEYEINQFDNRVRITNLPGKCTIRIFTVNGTLIRSITKENTGDTSLGSEANTKASTNPDISTISNAVDWDLKNNVGIPIASGLYIIHISSPGLPDKVIKWFGVMRPLDLDNY